MRRSANYLQAGDLKRSHMKVGEEATYHRMIPAWCCGLGLHKKVDWLEVKMATAKREG